MYLLSLRQIFRQPFFWVLNICTIVVSEITPPFAELFTFGSKERAVVDTSQAVTFCSILIFVLISAHSLLGRELYFRAALPLFSRPIEKHSVIVGKIVALITALFLFCLIQCLWTLKHAWVLGWSTLSIRLALVCMLSSFFQGVMLFCVSLTLTIFLGSFFGFFGAIVLFLAGYAVPDEVLKYFCFIIPAFPWFDLSEAFYRQNRITLPYILLLGLYTTTYSLLFLTIASIGLKRKQF